MTDSVIKINRSNGRLLGASLFLSDKDLEPFISTDSTHLIVEKILVVNGIFLKFTPHRPISYDKGDEKKYV